MSQSVARTVLWVVKGLGPGGAERLLVEVANSLVAADVALTCAYVVPAKNHLVGDLEAAGVHCDCIGRGHRLWWPMRLARLVRRGGYDVVHVHSPLPGSVARLAARTMRRSRRPIVLTTEHNSWSTYRRPTRTLNSFSSRWDEHTFAVSDEVARSIRGAAALGVSVLTHGIDVAKVRSRVSQRSRVRGELGIDGQQVVFATVANFREQKDYPNLLRACALLVERGVPIRVVAVGQGPLDQEIRALQRDFGLVGIVDLLGYRSDAVDVLAACDAFVLASKYEGLPVALMEACAIGLPAVLTDVGGMKAALGEDGALWVPASNHAALADAMAEVVYDKSRRRAFAEAAGRAAEKFDGHLAHAELRRWYLAGAPAANPLLSLGAGVHLRRATPNDLPAILDLCRASLGWDDADWDGLFHWKHFDNPFGPSAMWVAVADDRVVGIRAFLRWSFLCGDRSVRAVRAVDTATHPDFRGRGIFNALTLAAVDSVRSDGVDMVFNTPNSISRLGYLKMGWRDVGTLVPVVRIVRLRYLSKLVSSRVPAELWPRPCSVGRSVAEWLATDASTVLSEAPVAAGLGTVIDQQFALWRFGSPLQPCRVLGARDTVAVVQLRTRGSATELVCLASWGHGRPVDKLLVEAAREAQAHVVLRLGRPALRRGFLAVRRIGPQLTCLMLSDEPTPALAEWNLTMGDVALF